MKALADKAWMIATLALMLYTALCIVAQLAALDWSQTIWNFR